MALAATHIRFALDLKEKFEIKNVSNYLSGTIYPDSRYVTKLDRNLTHAKEYQDEQFYKNDDFRKGVAVHLLCDTVQAKLFSEYFSDVIPAGDVLAGSEPWIARTALKVVQDMDDATHFPIRDYVSRLEYVENPNGENVAQLQAYAQIFQQMYTKTVNIDAYARMWCELGITEELAERVRRQSEEYFANGSVRARIAEVYPQMRERVL